MRFEPRQYQTDTVEAWWDVLENSPEQRPIIAVPTGAGKTVIMGMLIRKYIDKYPYNKVLVLSHTQDILEQDYDALTEFFEDVEIGLYSSGLGLRQVCQITVAGIQSVYRTSGMFDWVNLIIIDECHTVNHKDSGMYRTFLGNHKGIIAGMSATVFRTGHGYVFENGAMFDTLAYDLTSLENFNKLIDDGYLTKLIPVSPEMEMNTDGIATSAGDYNVKQLGDRFDRLSITQRAVKELVYYGHNYKKWLIFAIDTDHADNICDELKANGIDAHVLHSKMHYGRQKTTNRFKKGKTRALVSVGMVTTGFDAPNVDLIALLRPTKSAVLHVQMIGRGLRIAEGKDHCLVLDFAGNTLRLGPINDVRVPKKAGKGIGGPMVKKCPNCRALNHISARHCFVCDEEFVFVVKLSERPDTTAIVKTKDKKEPKWMQVDRVQYGIHSKAGKPDSMIVVYHCGIQRIKEWICMDHNGYAKQKAIQWSKRRGYNGELTTEQLYEYSRELKTPEKIYVDFNEKYPSILQSIIS